MMQYTLREWLHKRRTYRILHKRGNLKMMSLINVNPIHAAKKIIYKKLTRELCKRFKTKMPIGRENKEQYLFLINHMVLEETTFEHINFVVDFDEDFLNEHPEISQYFRLLSPGEFPGDHDLENCIVSIKRVGNTILREAVIPSDEHGEIIKIPKPTFN